MFGERVDISNPISEALRVAPKLCSTDTQLLLADKYETTYGICNHNIVDDDRPLKLIAMHTSEDSSTGSMLYTKLEQFANHNVPKHFGLSLKDFLDFPRDICNEILRISANRNNVEMNTASNMLNQLENQKTKK